MEWYFDWLEYYDWRTPGEKALATILMLLVTAMVLPILFFLVAILWHFHWLGIIFLCLCLPAVGVYFAAKAADRKRYE